MNPSCRVVFGIMLLAIAAAPAAAADSPLAPVWASEPVYVIARVETPPRLDGDDPLSDASWKAAEVLGPLSLNAAFEPDDGRTEVRMLLSGKASGRDLAGGVLCVGARCLDGAPERIKGSPDAEELWRNDSLEFLFAQTPQKKFPLLHVLVGAGGNVKVVRYLQPFAPWAEPLVERPDASLMTVRVAVDRKGWWMVLAIPLDRFGLAAPPAFANVMRNRTADAGRFAWVDTFGGRFQRADRLGRLVGAAPPLKPIARLKLPATLAVGVNTLEFGGKNDTLVVDRPGTAEIAHYDKDNFREGTWSADVRRPLIVSAVKPFANDVAGPLAVEVTLAVAGTAKVSVEVTQDGKSLGRKEAELAAGKHAIDLPLAGAKPGEVAIVAKAEVLLGPGRSVALDARHWCVLALDAAEFDKFRPGIEKLPFPSLYRAAAADAVTYWRLIQAGDGRLVGIGRRGPAFNEWNQGMVYMMALLYKSDWPENPHRGDRRLLDSVALALDAELDPAKWQAMLDAPPNRDLEGALLAYDLIKDDVPPERRDAWKRGFETVIQAVVDTWATPLTYKFADYSDDVGTGTNHYAYHIFNVWLAGRTLGRADWETLGRDMMRRLARHEHDGQWPERRDVPASHYTWLTLHNVALYYFLSGDEQVREHVERGARFSASLCVPGGETLTLFDGRNNDHGSPMPGDIALSLTSEGRALARVRSARRIAADGRPSRTSPEGWLYVSTAARCFQPGDEKEPPERSEFALLDGRGLIARRDGFVYALSAICVPPIHGNFRLDPQNAIELYHAKAGWLLHGCNSQEQPEAGSFFRKRPDGVAFLPVEGGVQRTLAGHAARLKFETFEAQVLASAASPTEFEVRAELLKKTGDGPVVYSFFPGVGFDRQRGAPDEITLSADKRTLRFRNVTIECSRPIELERDFPIFNPYSTKREVRTKPVRAWTEIDLGRPLVLRITVAN